MRVLVLHSDIAPGAPPDEEDTLITARAVGQALEQRGHHTVQRAFVAEPVSFDATIAASRPDIVFNLVESVFAQGDLASISAAMLEKRGILFTGACAAALSCLADKPFTKRVLRAAGLPTPDWSEGPDWEGLADGIPYIVKSANEDASLGLDDCAVVSGRHAVRERSEKCASKYGGRWFAEAYLSGREFNVSLLEEEGMPRILPVAEIRFENWRADRPRIVGYAAKWDPESPDCSGTPRVFGLEPQSPLARAFAEHSAVAWRLFGLRGYARVDFRIDEQGAPMILEINPNPCLEPHAGFAAAAAEAGISYEELVEKILNAEIARRGEY